MFLELNRISVQTRITKKGYEYNICDLGKTYLSTSHIFYMIALNETYVDVQGSDIFSSWGEKLTVRESPEEIRFLIDKGGLK